jgi:hypothetical protein
MCLRSRLDGVGEEGGWYSRESWWRNGWCDDTETRRNGKPAPTLPGIAGYLHLHLHHSFVAFLPYQPKGSRDPATAGRGGDVKFVNAVDAVYAVDALLPTSVREWRF